MADIILTHRVTYDIRDTSSISDIANSLIANERLAKYSLLILEDLIEGFHVDSVDVKLKKSYTGVPTKRTFSFSHMRNFSKGFGTRSAPYN